MHCWILLLLLFFNLVSPSKDICTLHDSFKSVIDKFLKPFKGGITNDMIDQMARLELACLIVIKNGKRVQGDCLFPDYQIFIDSIAQYLPDMRFVISQHDGPVIYRHKCQYDTKQWCQCDKGYKVDPFNHVYLHNNTQTKNHKYNLPLFSPSTVPQCYSDIPFIPYAHLDKNAHGLINNFSWKMKKFKAFWRGSTTGYYFDSVQVADKFPRFRMVQLCKHISDCDAQFTTYLQCSPKTCWDLKQKYGTRPILNRMPFKCMQKFKLLIDIDGNANSSRFPFLMLMGSAVLKITTHQDLATMVTQPWQHYIPVKIDLSDLEEKIRWARENEREVERIADRGRKFIENVYNYKGLQCYVIHLLSAFAKLTVQK